MQKNHSSLIETEQIGWTLIRFLANTFKEVSKKQCKRWIDRGAVSVNGRVCTISSHTLHYLDCVTVYVTMQEERAKVQSTLKIIAEYPEFIICNKPIGLLSSTADLSKAISRKVEIVHRLDRETSGIILVAKTTNMQEILSSLFRQRKIQKEYIAIVPSGWKVESGRFTGKFKRISKPNATPIWTGKSQEGTLGVTDFCVMKRGKNFALLHLRPFTGRTHQLRVHCSEAGFPIVGDYQYGSTIRDARMYLHAYGLRFTNPKTQEEIHHYAPIPKEFEILLKR